MSYPPRPPKCVPTSSPLRGGRSCCPSSPFLQATQALLCTCLMSHMFNKLVKREHTPDNPVDRDSANELGFPIHLQAECSRIQTHTDALACQGCRDVIALEVDTDHAMAIDLALQMHAIE